MLKCGLKKELFTDKGGKRFCRLGSFKMKKYLKFAVAVVLIVLAVVIATVLGNRNTLKEAETTAAQTTLAPTIRFTTTLPTTTEPTKEPETLIDLDSMTIIDLFPLSLAGGNWDVRHCQGIAVDKEKGYIYYSYTTLLVKCDFDGNLVGSITGIDGHLGDITFNEADGKVYCGYYSPERTGFYAVIFDVDKITKMNMKPTAELVRTVFIKDAYDDFVYKTEIKKDDGSTIKLPRKYGCSGIDGVTFGPDFSKKTGKELLTIGYIILSDNTREDNNYQVLLQYDVTDWWDKIAKPYSNKASHRVGPDKASGKYFVYTGNTLYGIQTMEYFDELNLWILNCYQGSNPKFKNYSCFAIDADVLPQFTALKGQPKKDKQMTLALYQDGDLDKNNGIYGWHSKYGFQGVAYMGDGLFYVVRPYKNWTGTKTAICYLNVWAPNKSDPFVLAAGIGNDYSISKKPRVETTAPPTTAKQHTTKAPSSTKKNNKTETTKPFQGLGSLFGK